LAPRFLRTRVRTIRAVLRRGQSECTIDPRDRLDALRRRDGLCGAPPLVNCCTATCGAIGERILILDGSLLRALLPVEPSGRCLFLRNPHDFGRDLGLGLGRDDLPRLRFLRLLIVNAQSPGSGQSDGQLCRLKTKVNPRVEHSLHSLSRGNDSAYPPE
jgi:hypothetical protein